MGATISLILIIIIGVKKYRSGEAVIYDLVIVENLCEHKYGRIYNFVLIHCIHYWWSEQKYVNIFVKNRHLAKLQVQEQIV